MYFNFTFHFIVILFYFSPMRIYHWNFSYAFLSGPMSQRLWRWRLNALRTSPSDWEVSAIFLPPWGCCDPAAFPWEQGRCTPMLPWSPDPSAFILLPLCYSASFPTIHSAVSDKFMPNIWWVFLWLQINLKK